MEIDDIKRQMRNVVAPATDVPAQGNEPHDLDRLVTALMVVDSQDRRTARKAMFFLLLAGVFYALLFGLTGIAPPDDSPWMYRVVLLAVATAFLSVGLFLRRKSRDLEGIDYSAPVLAFLAAAERRCRFFRPADLVLVIPFLALLAIACTAGLMLGMRRYLPAWDPAWGLMACCVVFPLSAAAGFWFGLLHWRKERRPLRQQIQRMQVALGAAEALVDGDE